MPEIGTCLQHLHIHLVHSLINHTPVKVFVEKHPNFSDNFSVYSTLHFEHRQTLLTCLTETQDMIRCAGRGYNHFH